MTASGDARQSPRKALGSGGSEGATLRERRLGSLLRHERWDYAELFSVTLLLIWWSVMFRVIWTFSVIVGSGSLDVGWLSPSRNAPPILAIFVAILVLMSLATAGCLLDPRNRTRAGYGLACANAAFVTVLGVAVALHAVFAVEYADHRASGALSEWNLADGLAGRWDVANREEPESAPAFPASRFWLDFDGTSARVRFGELAPDVKDAWATLEGAQGFAPKTRLFERLEDLLFGEREHQRFGSFPVARIDGADYVHPALVVEAIVRPSIQDLPTDGWCVWAAELRQPSPRRLSFRLIRSDRRRKPDARVDFVRVDDPIAGSDVGEELEDSRQMAWW